MSFYFDRHFTMTSFQRTLSVRLSVETTLYAYKVIIFSDFDFVKTEENININETAPFDCDNSCNITLHLKNLFLDKNEERGKTKHQIQYEGQQRQHARLDRVRAEMTISEKRQSESNAECGVSNWLTTLPLKEWGYDLNKQQLWEAIRSYNWNLERLPTHCVWGGNFYISHALSC